MGNRAMKVSRHSRGVTTARQATARPENARHVPAKQLRIATARELASACATVARQCEVMAAIAARVPPPALRHFSPDFSGLAKIVVGQQLSAQSAAAIWGRVNGAVAPFEARSLAQHDDTALGALGLSRAKVKTLRAIADAVASGGLDFARLNRLPDAEIIAQLTRLHGVGPWTADIYLLFALRRADAFAAGDLALQIAAQRAFGLAERPGPTALLELAERWRPWRAAAARLLWADYAHRPSGTQVREAVDSGPQANTPTDCSDVKKPRSARTGRKPSQN